MTGGIENNVAIILFYILASGWKQICSMNETCHVIYVKLCNTLCPFCLEDVIYERMKHNNINE